MPCKRPRGRDRVGTITFPSGTARLAGERGSKLRPSSCGGPSVTYRAACPCPVHHLDPVRGHRLGTPSCFDSACRRRLGLCPCRCRPVASPCLGPFGMNSRQPPEAWPNRLATGFEHPQRLAGAEPGFDPTVLALIAIRFSLVPVHRKPASRATTDNIPTRSRCFSRASASCHRHGPSVYLGLMSSF